MVFMSSSGVETWSLESLSSQYPARSARAASTAAASRYFARTRRPSSRSPSPSIHTRRASSPGANVSRLCRTAQWLPPFSAEPPQAPCSTARGLDSVR